MLCNDILLSIFEFLNYFTRVECSLVCKNWYHLISYSYKHSYDTDKLTYYFKLHSLLKWDDEFQHSEENRFRFVFDDEIGLGIFVDCNNIFLITPFRKFKKLHDFGNLNNEIYIHHLKSSTLFIVHLTKQPSATFIIDYSDLTNIKLSILYQDCSANLNEFNIKCRICTSLSKSSQDNIPAQIYKHTQNYCIYYTPPTIYHFWAFYDPHLKRINTKINHLCFLLLPDGKILINRQDVWMIESDDESEKETVHLSYQQFHQEILNHYYGSGSNVISLGKHGYVISTTDYTNHFVLLQKQHQWVLELIDIKTNQKFFPSFCAKNDKIYFFGLKTNKMISYDIKRLIDC
jgi:hypothetical protein